MNDASSLPHLKFGVGQPVHRKEDPRLVRGRGRYADDIDLPGQAFARVVRSHRPHGRIRRIDRHRALAMPGVLAVYTGADLAAAGYGAILCKLPLKNADGSPLFAPPRPILAEGRVRFVGEPLAVVIAEDLQVARDAAELIEVDVEPLPAVADPEAAIGEAAPRLHDDHANLCLDWRFGDHEAAARAVAGAAHVAKIRLVSNRVVVAAMEPRAAVAEYDPNSERLTLHVGCQGVFGLRRSLAEDLLKIEPERLRVLAHDVGGSFGMKAAAYPEYVAILHAARALGRPVKWCDERSDSFLSDQQGRGTIVEGELALDEAGNFLAVRVRNLADMGAYLTAVGPMMPAVNMQKNLPSLYRTPIVAISTRCAFTNTVPIGPYRGAGRPEANYVMERLVDLAARETGRDPAALRRQNLIPKDAIPYQAASGLKYDSGDFAAVLDAGLEHADWNGFETRRQSSERAGKLRGRGLACYLEVTAPPNPEMGGIRFEADGRISIVTGTLDYGQGHASAFAQVLVDRLGLPFELIDLIQGDSDQLLAGGGTGGSRWIMSSGKALVEAAAEVIEKGRALAGHFLEAAAARIHSTAACSGSPAPIAPSRCSISRPERARRTACPTTCRRASMRRSSSTRRPIRVSQRLPRPRGGGGSGDRGGAAGWATPRSTTSAPSSTRCWPRARSSAAWPRASVRRCWRRRCTTRAGQPVGRLAWTTPCPRRQRAGDRSRLSSGAGDEQSARRQRLRRGRVTGALPAVMNAIVDALATRGVRHVDMPATPRADLARSANRGKRRRLRSTRSPVRADEDPIRSRVCDCPLTRTERLADLQSATCPAFSTWLGSPP